jgi:nitrogen regulatory protein PII
MAKFLDKQGFTLVTLIIPQSRLHTFMNELLHHWPYKAIQFDCRGTIIRDQWFQALLPVMNPESEYLQFIIKDHEVVDFMTFCIDINDLHLPGSGAIFSSKFSHLSANSADLLSDQTRPSEVQSAPSDKELHVPFKTNLFAVYALLQSGRTEQAIKAAIQAGSHGPIVYFVEGRGTRDRAGWLKITKKPYEEVLMVLVESSDRASVIEAIANAGNVGALGSGVVFDMEIDSGLVNLPTSMGKKNQRSSNEEITAAIDHLMGNADWRDRSNMNSLMAKVASSNMGTQGYKSVLLTALLPRKHANDFLDQILILGIPGANVIYAKLFSAQDAKNPTGLHIHHEIAQIRMVVSEIECIKYRLQLQTFAQQSLYSDVILYEQELSEVIRYQAKEKEVQGGDYYRGAKLN